jgi:hypothetical protein
MKESSVLDNKLLKKLGVLDWGYTEEPIPETLITLNVGLKNLFTVH